MLWDEFGLLTVSGGKGCYCVHPPTCMTVSANRNQTRCICSVFKVSLFNGRPACEQSRTMSGVLERWKPPCWEETKISKHGQNSLIRKVLNSAAKTETHNQSNSNYWLKDVLAKINTKVQPANILIMRILHFFCLSFSFELLASIKKETLEHYFLIKILYWL